MKRSASWTTLAALLFSAGMTATARILEVTGGGRRENLGVNIAISLA